MLAFFLLQVCYIILMDLSVKPDQLIPNLFMVGMFRGRLIIYVSNAKNNFVFNVTLLGFDS